MPSYLTSSDFLMPSYLTSDLYASRSSIPNNMKLDFCTSESSISDCPTAIDITSNDSALDYSISNCSTASCFMSRFLASDPNASNFSTSRYLISFDTCASGHSIPDSCSTPSFPVTNFSTAGSKDTTGVKGTTDVKGTSATTTTAVKATTDVNGTFGCQGAIGSVSGNDETPGPSSCAKVILRQDSRASCSCAKIHAFPAPAHAASAHAVPALAVPTTDAASKIRRSRTVRSAPKQRHRRRVFWLSSCPCLFRQPLVLLRASGRIVL